MSTYKLKMQERLVQLAFLLWDLNSLKNSNRTTQSISSINWIGVL
jgi:hypothetical protein